MNAELDLGQADLRRIFVQRDTMVAGAGLNDRETVEFVIERAPAIWTLGVQIIAIFLLFGSFWRLSPRSALVAAISSLVSGRFCAGTV